MHWSYSSRRGSDKHYQACRVLVPCIVKLYRAEILVPPLHALLPIAMFVYARSADSVASLSFKPVDRSDSTGGHASQPMTRSGKTRFHFYTQQRHLISLISYVDAIRSETCHPIPLAAENASSQMDSWGVTSLCFHWEERLETICHGKVIRSALRLHGTKINNL